MTERRYSWWSRSSVAVSRSSGRRPSASTSSAARPAWNAPSACGTDAGRTPRRGLRRQVRRGHDRDRDHRGIHRERDRAEAGRLTPREGRAAEHRRSRVVGVALDARREVDDDVVGERLGLGDQTPCGDDAGDDRCGRRPEPPTVRDAVVADEVQPGLRRTDVVQRGTQRADDEVLLVVRDLPRALAGDLDPDARANRARAPRARRRGPARGRTRRTPGRGWRSSPGRARGRGPPRAARRQSRLSAVAMDTTSDVHPHRDDLAAVGRAQRPLGVLEAVPRHGDDDLRASRDPAGLVHGEQAGHARRRRRLDEDADLGREHPVRGEDLLVGDGLDQTAGDVARLDRLLPGRRVADPDRRGDGLGLVDRVAAHDRGGAVGLEAPHDRGARRDGVGALGVLAVALPVGGDVARVADGQDVDVGSVAQRVDDLERRGLLALDRSGFTEFTSSTG